MIDKIHIKKLSEFVGSENVFTDKTHLRVYSYDATRVHYSPEAVIFPRDEQDVSKILAYCNRYKIPIVPRGAGSGFYRWISPVMGDCLAL